MLGPDRPRRKEHSPLVNKSLIVSFSPYYRRVSHVKNVLESNNKLCLSMHPEMDTTAGSRSLRVEFNRAAKLLLGGVENTLNFLFSFVVLVAATLIAALLHGHFGVYPLRGFVDAVILLTWMAGIFTLAEIGRAACRERV